MLSEEVKRYRELSGDTNPHTPISRIGGYLDGYERALDQEPCEDCISREDALMALTGEWTELTDEIIYRFIKRIKSLPLVTPAEKTGRWEWVQYDGNPSIGNWHCSECRTIIPHMPEETDNTPIYKWCPMCGAKMHISAE